MSTSTQGRRRCRRMSNELAGSVRLDQLRQLQSQLSELIKHDDKLDEDIIHIDDIDDSYTSSLSTSSRERCISDGASIGGNDDIESGKITTVYRPQRHQQHTYEVDPTLNHGQSSTTSFVSPTSSDNSADENESISSSGRTAKTVSTSGSSRYGTRPTLRRRSSSLFRKDTNGNRRSIRHLPTYDFLRKDNDKKEGRSLLPNGKWWHTVFLFSLISMIACILTLWLPYPFGARMNSEQVAAMGYSSGCQGVQTCICPRETICADDALSMIFLTIARASAWFSYPLYMLLFLSKANNLNNFLQTTALRCWINFSDYHHVHSLFGIIVGFESMSHSFFHILRWVRRNNDIQVCIYHVYKSPSLTLRSNFFFPLLLSQPQLLWTSQTGITGLIAIFVCPLIVLPMTVPSLKKRMSFELRKGLHYLRKVRVSISEDVCSLPLHTACTN